MKRDMDLVREILFLLEARDSEDNQIDVDVHGRSHREVGEHLQIMEEAGLVRGVSLTSTGAACLGLTWGGHDFLDKARNDTVWQRAKDLVLKKTGGLSIDVLKAALTKLALDALQVH